jgi:hypothetical protein
LGVGVFTEEDKFHQRLRELKTIVANLNRLNLTPAQAGQRDALAQRVATVEGNVAKGRADAEAKVAALDQQAAEAAKKACGWTCSDQGVPQGKAARSRLAGPARGTVMVRRRARTKTPRKSDRGNPQKSMVLMSTSALYGNICFCMDAPYVSSVPNGKVN